MELEVEGWLEEARLGWLLNSPDLPPSASSALVVVGEHEADLRTRRRKRLAAERSSLWITYQSWWSHRWNSGLGGVLLLNQAPPPEPPLPFLGTRPALTQ